MSKERVSIIVPVFNASSTLSRALSSVKSQTYSSIELIVVDGKSTDDSLELAKSFSPDVLISETDTGIYQAMNRGVERATGKWIYFLGADDQLAADDVMEMLLAELPDADLICGHVQNENRPDPRIPKLYKNRLNSKIRFRNILHHQGVVYNKSCFRNFRFDESLKILGDYDLNLYLYQKGARAFCTDVIVAKSDATGLSKNFGKSLYSEELRVKRKHFGPFQMLIQHLWVWMKYVFKNA